MLLRAVGRYANELYVGGAEQEQTEALPDWFTEGDGSESQTRGSPITKAESALGITGTRMYARACMHTSIAVPACNTYAWDHRHMHGLVRHVRASSVRVRMHTCTHSTQCTQHAHAMQRIACMHVHPSWARTHMGWQCT